MTDTETTGLAQVEAVDDGLGVKQSPVFDTLIVDSRGWDNSNEPKRQIAELSPGDTLVVAGVEFAVSSVGKRCTFGQEGVYSLGVPPEAFGTVGSLYVDRDPYLLNICNGPIYVVEPSEVNIK